MNEYTLTSVEITLYAPPWISSFLSDILFFVGNIAFVLDI